MIDPTPLDSVPFMELLRFYLPKVVAATLCGGMVGVERELKHKVVGVKTNILICVGVTLFAATGFAVDHLIGKVGGNFDATRLPGTIIGQIITGVGFLGAGAVFKSNDRVIGLTTAAFVWMNAAIGVIIGAGGIDIAVALTAGLMTVTVVLSKIEQVYFRKDVT